MAVDLDELASLVVRLRSDHCAYRDESSDIRRVLRQASTLIAELRAARAENMCDACGGNGVPVSLAPCMCGGTGKMSDAARILRRDLIDAIAERDAARAECERLRGLMTFKAEEPTGSERLAAFVASLPEPEPALTAIMTCLRCGASRR